MRVLVCGGRDFDDVKRLYDVLDTLHARQPISLIIHGAARGADSFAGQWARSRGVAVQAFRADWSRYGRPAGPRRNMKMLEVGRPDRVVAFPGGRGTSHMCRIAEAAGVPVQRV